MRKSVYVVRKETKRKKSPPSSPPVAPSPVPVALVSLGCPKNLVDSEALAGSLPPERYRLTSRLSEAQVIVVNTCAFLESARRESRETLRRLSSWKKKRCRVLVAAGCLPQFLGAAAARELPEADLILGPGEWPVLERELSALLAGGGRPRLRLRRVPRYPPGEWPRLGLTLPHSAYLKIADGCDNRCAYCLIGRLRGPYRSRPLPVLLEEARRLAERGAREVVLVAHDTAFYGREKTGRSLLPRLLEELEAIKGISWIRLLYLHPAHLDRDFLKTIAASRKVCPYLDVPLQHINDRVLARMGRPLARSAIEALLDQAREFIPGLALRTTLMVGFPGEGAREFGELKEFVRWQRFDHLGVFAYSPEKGTRSAGFRPRVPPPIAERRREELMRLQKGLSRSRLKRRIGKEIEVLVDGPFPGDGSDLMIGHGRCQAPEIDGLTVLEGEGMSPGDLVKARVTASSDYDLYAVKL